MVLVQEDSAVIVIVQENSELSDVFASAVSSGSGTMVNIQNRCFFSEVTLYSCDAILLDVI